MIFRVKRDAFPGHVATDVLSVFDREYRAVDSSFWKVVDGARSAASAKSRPYTYCLPDEVRDVVLKNHKISHYLHGKALEREVSARASNVPLQKSAPQFIADSVLDICMMAAFRSCKYIVRVHPSIEADLANCDLPVDIPTSVFTKLPSWSFFLEFGVEFRSGSALSGYDGVFVTMLDHSTQLGEIYVKAISTRGSEVIIVRLGMLETQGISALVNNDSVIAPEEGRAERAALIRYVANVCMFIASNEPGYKGEARPAFPKREKTFYGMVCREAVPQILELGEDGCHSSASMPVRSSHWSCTWLGQRVPGMQPIENIRRLTVEWIAPAPAAAESIELETMGPEHDLADA